MKYFFSGKVAAERPVALDVPAEALFESDPSFPPVSVVVPMHNRDYRLHTHLVVPVNQVRSVVVSLAE